MSADIAPLLDRAAVCRGAGALCEALDLIGDTEKTDRDLAKVVCDAKMDLRAMLKFVFAKLATE